MTNFFKTPIRFSLRKYRDTIYFTLVRGFSLLFSLLISIVISRNTSSETFNSFSFIEKLIGIGVVLYLFGGRQTILTSNIEKENSYLNTIIYNRTGIFFLIVIPSIIIVLNVNLFNDWPLILIVLLSVLFSGLIKILNSITLKKNQLYVFSFFENNVIPNLIFLLAFFLFPKELSYFLVYLIIGKLIIVACLVLMHDKFLFNKTQKLSFSIEEQKLELISSSFFFFNSAFSLFYKSLPLLLLFNTLETNSYNALVIALKISLIPSIFLDLLNNYVSKKVSKALTKNDIRGLKSIYLSSTRIGVILGFVTLFFIVIFGKQLISLWGSTNNHIFYFLLILFVGDFVDLSFASTGIIMNLGGMKKKLNKLYLFLIPITILFLLFSSIQFDLYGVVWTLSFIKILFNIAKYNYITKII